MVKTADTSDVEKNKGGRPRRYATPKIMQKEIDAYFSENQESPTMSGLAFHLGFDDRHGLSQYANYDEFSTTIKKARSRVEMALEKHLYGGQVAGAIFNLKNNFGWKDKREIEGNLTLNDMRSQLYGKDSDDG